MLASLLPNDTFDSREELVFRSLKVLTFFVTTTCNAKCETCFYWMNLNDDHVKLLSLEEIERLSQTMPRFPHLLFSGGEPVMRREIADIAAIFARNNGLQSVDMPTNGLLTKRVIDVVSRMLDENPHLMITVGHSLDGFEETHDRLRGVRNNFKKLFETMAALQELRKERQSRFEAGTGPEPRLKLVTLTCINNQNLGEVERLAEWVTSNHDVDGMMFECLRGTPKDPNLLPPTTEQFDRVIELSIRTNERLYAKRFPEEKARKLSYIRNVYRAQREHLTGGKIPMTCQAGVNLAVLEPDGRVRLCELLDEVGDLRGQELNWRKVWFSEEANRQRGWIKSSRCSCTHCVNLGHSIDASLRTRVQRQVDEFVFSKS